MYLYNIVPAYHIHFICVCFVQNGDTVLHHAVKELHVDVVKTLLKKNPDIDVKGGVCRKSV